MANFPSSFFQAIQARKMSFTIFQNQKKPFQAIKRRSSNSRKIDIFPKGLTHGFGPKMAIFPTAFLGNIGQQNVFYDNLERKKTPFQAIKTRNSKTQKIDMVLVQKWPIFQLSFFSQYTPEKCLFTIFQNQTTPFQATKTRISNSRKNDIFPNGLTHAFGPKMAIFPTFFLGNIGQENVFYDILEAKNTFQAIKTQSSKSRKIDIIPKGLTHGFGPKMAFFQTFFFRHYRPRKCVLQYSRNKKYPSRL